MNPFVMLLLSDYCHKKGTWHLRTTLLHLFSNVLLDLKMFDSMTASLLPHCLTRVHIHTHTCTLFKMLLYSLDKQKDLERHIWNDRYKL